MLRVRAIVLDTWRSHYHRIRAPRANALAQYIVTEERRLRERAATSRAGKPASQPASSTHITAQSGYHAGLTSTNGAAKHPEQPHRYNRFFVNDECEFVATQAFVEDPEVIERRRNTCLNSVPKRSFFNFNPA